MYELATRMLLTLEEENKHFDILDRVQSVSSRGYFKRVTLHLSAFILVF